MTVAASAIAECKIFGHLSYRIATRRQSLTLPNMISMRFRRLYRRLYRRLSYLTVALCCFRPRMQVHITLLAMCRSIVDYIMGPRAFRVGHLTMK